MKQFQSIIIAIAVLFLSACAGLSQTLNDHEVLSYITIKNSTAQYIDKTGDTDETKKAKARRILSAVNTAEIFIDSNPTSSIGGVVDVVKSQVNYSALPVADRLLIDDLIFIASRSIKVEQEAKQLPDEYVVNIKKVLNAVKAGAVVFL